MLSDRLARVIACPDCRRHLAPMPRGLMCPKCKVEYGLAATGAPVLFGWRSEFRERTEAYLSQARGQPYFAGNTEAAAPRIPLQRRLLPATTPYQMTAAHLNQAVNVQPGSIIVNLGAGRRDRRPDVDWVNLDIVPEPHVDIVADAHQLPFIDNSVAAIVSTNVFEYLRNPWQAAGEIVRVLSPGGAVFVNSALILPLSTPDYHDRFRFTGKGLANIFDALEVIAVGPSSGPVMALARVMDRAIDVIVPGRVFPFVIRTSLGWLVQPFKYLDPWILRRDERGASGFFLLARKAR